MGLLKGIDPLLTADLLHVLRSMGHGDKLLVCDCNFPAAEVATKTTTGKNIVLTVPLPEVLGAICSVLPLDCFVGCPVVYMSPSEGIQVPSDAEEVWTESETAIQKHAPEVFIRPQERFNFYDSARTCFAVVQTSERRPYGNIILQKGVVGPDGKDLVPQYGDDNSSEEYDSAEEGDEVPTEC